MGASQFRLRNITFNQQKSDYRTLLIASSATWINENANLLSKSERRNVAKGKSKKNWRYWTINMKQRSSFKVNGRQMILWVMFMVNISMDSTDWQDLIIRPMFSMQCNATQCNARCTRNAQINSTIEHMQITQSQCSFGHRLLNCIYLVYFSNSMPIYSYWPSKRDQCATKKPD